MVRITIRRSHLNDIHIFLRQLQEFNALLQRIAALWLLCGELDLDEHIVARNLLDLLQHHKREPTAVLKAAAELVGTEVGERRKQLAGHLRTIAHVDGHSVKAKLFIQCRALTITLRNFIEVLCGHIISNAAPHTGAVSDWGCRIS